MLRRTQPRVERWRRRMLFRAAVRQSLRYGWRLNRKNVRTLGVGLKIVDDEITDRIAVIADGKVSELGTHQELLAANNRYAQLFELQASGYR